MGDWGIGLLKCPTQSPSPYINHDGIWPPSVKKVSVLLKLKNEYLEKKQVEQTYD